MIIDPDFLDHWRTRMLVNLLGGDEFAPIYLIRLWAHCQTRKGDRFAMPSAGLKALCKFAGDQALLESSMVSAGFIEREGVEIYVPKWAEKNSALLAAWDNGKRGGRPKKETQSKPTGNPTETHGKPNHNPDETDKIRVDKIRREIGTSSLVASPDGEATNDDNNPPDLPKIPATPLGSIIERYAELCPSLAQVRLMTEKRKQYARRLWLAAGVYARKNEGKDGMDETALRWRFVDALFRAAEASKFCRGEKNRQGSGHENWKADLEFVTRAEPMAKILEGRYDD